MVGANGSWLCQQQQSPWESTAFRNSMIAPVELRQHKFLPASVNPHSVSANLGLNGFGVFGLPERGLMQPHFQTPLHSPNGFPAQVDAPTSTYGAPYPQPKRFVIFDQSGNETRLMFSSLCPPRVQNLTTAQTNHPLWNQQTCQFYAQGQANKRGQTYIKTPVLDEESGENETVDEGSEMREDTEEINALLYSDDDDDFDGEDDDDDDDDDDDVSTGHSPLVKQEEQKQEQEQDFEEVASFDRSSKRQKASDGGCTTTTMGKRYVSYKNVCGGDLDMDLDLISGLDEGVGPTIGNKRPRKDKIRHTLKVLESIIPDVKSKDPLTFLDEAISYLKSLRSNAKTMSMDDPDSSSCYGPSN